MTHYSINHTDVIIEYLPTELMIIHLHTGHHYALPIIAKQIWLMLEKNTPLKIIVATITKHYRQSYLNVMENSLRFIQQLLAEGLIKRSPSPQMFDHIQIEHILREDAHFGWNYHPPELFRYEDHRGLIKYPSSSDYASSSPVTFWHELIQHFQTAAAQTSSIDKYYKLAGYTLHLQFTNTRFANLIIPALAHLECDACHLADLTIHIWDSASVNLTTIQYPWGKQDYTLRGEIIGFNNHDFYTMVDVHTKALTMLNRKDNTACYWIQDMNDLPWWISGSPLQQIIHWWLRDRDLQLTHAAAVGYPEGGVLLAGRSGSGKSTTTLACLEANMHYISEDYCLLSILPQPLAYSVYNSAKLEDTSLEFFPALKKNVVNVERAPGDKAFLFQHQYQPEKILAQMPLRAVVKLQVTHCDKSELKCISADEALAALALSTMWQLTHTGKRTLIHLQKIVVALPCYSLELGRDLRQIPSIIAGLVHPN